MPTAPHVVVLAAGKGAAMSSPLPKVLHPVLGRPMLHYVLDAARAIPHRSISVVVGHGEEAVRAQCADYSEVQFFRQERQLGTADAVRAARGFLTTAGGTVLVLCGDVILVTPDSLVRLLETHERERADCTVGASRAGGGRVYCFEAAPLLQELENGTGGKKEYRLPDAVRALAKSGARLAEFPFEDPAETLGIDDLCGHWRVETLMRERLARDWMLRGVRILDPRVTYIDGRCRIEPGAVIEPGVHLANATIGAGARIEAYSRISDSSIGAGVHVKQGSYIEESEVGENASVGPYAHLRPGSKLGARVRIGNFVEVKKSVIGEDSQASHLTYIGDAEIGKRVNLGCGFITCNFDGIKKSKTVIEDDVFVGSDSQAVAPVRISSGSFIATGTCVTEDVPPESLSISRGRQVNKVGYAKKYRRPKQEA